MDDRNVQYPNRFQLTKVDGTDDIYEIIPAPGKVYTEGTFINKFALLKDTTAALFGLGVDNVPDDVLVFLGKYNQYWWKRRTSGFALVPNLGAEQIQCVEWQGRPNSGSYTPTNHIRYSPTVTVHEDLSVTLNNPQVLTFTPNGIGSNLQVLQGKYFYLTKQVNSVAHGNWGNIDYKTTPANVIYYASGAPTGKQNSADSEDYTYVAEAIPAKTVTGKKELHDGPWEYVRSSARDAYPDSGIHDGYEYQFLGIPFENSVLPLRVETGSYVGTGTYGINNPCSLTLPFEPKLFIVGDTDGRKGTRGNNLYFALPIFLGDTYEKIQWKYGGTTATQYTLMKREGSTISWYINFTGSGSDQLNGTGTTYYYYAIG